MLPTREQLTEHLTRLVDIRLLDPVEILLDGDDTVDVLRTVVRNRAKTWVARLLDGDEQEATMAIVRLLSTLYPGDGPFQPAADWWATPLGRVVAWRVGHPSADSVSYTVAGAMLGITRQGVHDLVNRGKLARHPDGGVVPTSVRDRLVQLEGQPGVQPEEQSKAQPEGRSKAQLEGRSKHA